MPKFTNEKNESFNAKNQGLFLLWLTKDCEMGTGIQAVKPELETIVKYLKSQEKQTDIIDMNIYLAA